MDYKNPLSCEQLWGFIFIQFATCRLISGNTKIPFAVRSLGDLSLYYD